MTYTQALDLKDALAALASGQGKIIAGGTDHFPSHPRPGSAPLVDISRAADLRGISIEEDCIRLGAAVTWSSLIDTPLPAAFDGLKQAAREVGSRQIQNAGTIAGNLCNASPAADGVPPLLTLDARVEIAALTGTREVPLETFITGVRQTALRPGEIVSAVVVPRPDPALRGAFSKLGSRRYLVISIAMVAGAIALSADGRIAQARLSVGACSPVAQRQPDLEASIVGKRPEEVVVTSEMFAGLSPIDDIRGDAAFRLGAAAVMATRLVRGFAAS